jgi:phosphohistidine phosphatase
MQEVVMELIFLRHGLAGERSEWQGRDEDRPLTEAGKAQTAREAAGLKKAGLVPDLIVTSPLVRARQTAEIVARELGIPGRVAIDEGLSPGFRRKQLRRILEQHGGHGRLMIVGHEPDFSKVVGRATGGEVVLDKGGVAVVEVTDRKAPAGRLVWLVRPGLLEGA